MARDDDFNKDNLFGDEEDDFANFDDDSYDDESMDFDDEFDLGLDEDTDSVELSDEELAGGSESGGGPSRTFILLAGALILVLLLGLGLIVGLFFLNRGPSETQQTATSIAATNVVRVAQIQASETQNALDVAATMTATAMFTASPTPSPTATDTPPPTEDIGATQTAAFEATIKAADIIATQNVAASATVLQQTLVPSDLVTQAPVIVVTTEPGGEVTQDVSGTMPTALPTVEISAVQQTATALAVLFEATPTPEDVSGTGGSTILPGATTEPGTTVGIGGGQTELPDTGLFDDVFQGDPALVFLAAFGLLGVIVVSRRMRSGSRK